MIEIKPNIFRTGKTDWELKHFHGHELSTHNGSSYNSYLIKDDKKVLVDTVWYPYLEDFQRDMADEIADLDAVIINHMEPDHGGSLEVITSIKPDIPIYCTKNGAEIIKAHFHKDFNFQIVKTGDELCTGKYTLRFVEMRMIHWPDSMMVYVDGVNLLLSNDAFGQHYAPAGLFDDQADSDVLMKEAFKYYANIVSPFNSIVKKKLEEVLALNLDIDMIAPGHGYIWRKEPGKILEAYSKWCQPEGDGSVCITFDTMYDSTKRAAEYIGRGLEDEGILYRVYNVATEDRSDLIADIYGSSGLIMGSCTVLNNTLRDTTSLLEDLKNLRMKGKLAAAFGSYGWSGEGPKNIYDKLKAIGMEMFGDPIKIKYRPDDKVIEELIEFGRGFGKMLKSKA